MSKLRDGVVGVLSSGSGEQPRPRLGRGNESSVRGLHVVGDLAGAPVIKLAMAQAVEVVEWTAERLKPGSDAARDSQEAKEVLDLVIAGAGAAGLNAALAAQEKGLSCVVLEKERIANTIENFPEGKWVYAEPDSHPPRGKLWLDGARKEDLVARWRQIVEENHLDVRVGEPLVALDKRPDGVFRVTTPHRELLARRVILATGQRGNPRKLGVPGEEREEVYHQLYSPTSYRDERILVVGGGNSAVEAALALCARNRVLLSYRGEAFGRVFEENRRRLDEEVAAGRIELVLRSRVMEFREGEAVVEVEGPEGAVGVEERAVPLDHAFVLIGAELPVSFLRGLGIGLENDWRGRPLASALLTLLTLCGLWLWGSAHGGAAPLGLDWGSGWVWGGALVAAGAAAGLAGLGVRGDRWGWLGLSFLVCYTVYGVKVGSGTEFWPYRGWGYDALSLFQRPWSFWYTVLYTLVMTGFGLGALKRWGLDRRDTFQIWRFTSLLGFQWVFFFLVPEFLFQWAIRYQWVGERLASDPQFADQAWRSYGIVYAWPLFFYTWLYDPHQIWVIWGVVLTFGLVPLLVLFHGKRYCSWICGCGGLAETLGDRWRHLAPKGRRATRLEGMGTVVLVLAVVVTALVLLKDALALTRTADASLGFYRIMIDVWLVGILPVTLYPFLGGKVWCRYWCPLAKLMELESRWLTRRGWSRFRIVANEKCIACHECSRYCQVGIDVMRYALARQPLDNATSSCIGCGVCVTVCPMDTLSFGAPQRAQTASTGSPAVAARRGSARPRTPPPPRNAPPPSPPGPGSPAAR